MDGGEAKDEGKKEEKQTNEDTQGYDDGGPKPRVFQSGIVHNASYFGRTQDVRAEGPDILLMTIWDFDLRA